LEKKKIAFIEMETHSALLEQWYLLLKEMTSIDFYFFVHNKVNKKISSIPKEKITLVDNVNEIDFDAFDGVVVNTLHRNFEQYSALFQQKPVLCLVHNINFSLFFKQINWENLWLEKERFYYYLKLYFLEKVGQRRKVILQAEQLGVLSKCLYEEIKANEISEDKAQLIQMNYCHSAVFGKKDTIHIVMPGNVSNKRKDIAMLFEILPKLKPKTPLHFTFLGKPESGRVAKKIEWLKLNCFKNITITYFSEFIPWEKYSEAISKAHLLLCPIKEETSFYWVDEFYGYTKVSGSEADCIHNGKIGLFPSAYPKMDWHNLYYESAPHLASILNQLEIDQLAGEYQKLRPYLSNYSFEKVKKQLEEQLLNLTKAK
jgi:hypothetical protein